MPWSRRSRTVPSSRRGRRPGTISRRGGRLSRDTELCSAFGAPEDSFLQSGDFLVLGLQLFLEGLDLLLFGDVGDGRFLGAAEDAVAAEDVVEVELVWHFTSS